MSEKKIENARETVIDCIMEQAQVFASTYFLVGSAADAYVAEKGIEHSGGIIEAAFEAGARWGRERSLAIVDEYYGGGRSFVMRKISALASAEVEG